MLVRYAGLYYNPYFPGGAIGMPAPLIDEAVTFADGTPATVSQMAKDVTAFLSWAAEPELEERKLMGIRALTGFVITAAFAGCVTCCGVTCSTAWPPLPRRSARCWLAWHW